MNIYYGTCLSDSDSSGKRKFAPDHLSFDHAENEGPRAEKTCKDDKDNVFAPTNIRKKIKFLVEQADCVDKE